MGVEASQTQENAWIISFIHRASTIYVSRVATLKKLFAKGAVPFIIYYLKMAGRIETIMYVAFLQKV